MATQPRSGHVRITNISDLPAAPRREGRDACPSRKIRHSSEAVALEALVRVRRDRVRTGDPGPHESRVYHCGRCDGWHLTSQPLAVASFNIERERSGGETWEQYAHRLEKRIQAQRAELMSLQAIGAAAGNREARKQIAGLIVALGRMTQRWEIERGHRQELLQLLDERCSCWWCRLRRRQP